jgi:hypothetical protein
MNETILEGMWFVTNSTHASFKWQGRILGKVEKEVYAVQLHEWMFGTESVVKLVTLDDILEWDFYHSAEDLREAIEVKKDE